MKLRSPSYPHPSLRFTLSVQPADRQGQRCMQLLSEVLTLDGLTGMDWALLRLLPPKG